MDKSIVAVEESDRRIDSPASASKSLGSLIQINSIAIDISCAMEEIESPLHDHFSMRGFVAGMRKKDLKTCMPFASQGVSDDLVDNNLPPLSVPKFRWWQCSNCVPDVAAKSTALEMLLVSRRDACTSSCQDVGREKDDMFSISIRNIGNGLTKKAIVGKYNDQSSKIPNADPHCNGQKVTTSLKEKTDVRKNDCGTTSAHMTKANPVRIRERHDSVIADASDTVRIAQNVCMGLDEPDNVSSGSDAAICALPRRRKMKLRSLADIMEDENNSTSEHIKKRSALSSEMQVTSTEKEDDLHCHPELEAPEDVATVARGPHRKIKITDEEDRGPPQATNSLSTAKRLKGPILDLEKRRRIPEECDSESVEDGSAQSDFQHNENIQPIKHKRNKALEINRRMKQNHIGNNTVPIREVPKIGSMLPESLQKHAASVKTSYDNMKLVPPALRGEMEPYLNSLMSGKQVNRISRKSKSKRPEVEVDPSPLIPSRKRFIGDSSVQGKLALDLSLNSCAYAERNSNQISWRQHRGLPDLNESFTEKSSASQWKQLKNSEDRRSALHKNLDMGTSCSKKINGEGRRQFGESEPQAVQKMRNIVEPGGTSDDIPMDIVELLAKNQRERTLENSRNHLLSSTGNNSIRGSPASYGDQRPGFINFPAVYARSGISAACGETRLSQGILNFQNCQLDNGNMEENQFRFFSPFKPCQAKKTQYSVSNPLFSGPRTSEGADLLWPPRRKNAPFHFDRSVQHNGPDVQPFLNQRYKGKTISDMKGESRKVVHDASAVKEGKIGPSTKSAGSLDAYSNDTIPAMQLLSLMDHGIASGSSLRVGSNSNLDKTFSPCNHHPRLKVNKQQNDPFLERSFFSQGGHNKDFPPLLNGVHFSGQSSNKSYAQGHMPPPQGNTKAFNLDVPDTVAIQPSRNDVGLEFCSLNRNPADFSIPDAKNEYTLTARDLKWRKKKSLKENVILLGQKRGRVRKVGYGK